MSPRREVDSNLLLLESSHPNFHNPSLLKTFRMNSARATLLPRKNNQSRALENSPPKRTGKEPAHRQLCRLSLRDQLVKLSLKSKLKHRDRLNKRKSNRLYNQLIRFTNSLLRLLQNRSRIILIKEVHRLQIVKRIYQLNNRESSNRRKQMLKKQLIRNLDLQILLNLKMKLLCRLLEDKEEVQLKGNKISRTKKRKRRKKSRLLLILL